MSMILYDLGNKLSMKIKSFYISQIYWHVTVKELRQV